MSLAIVCIQRKAFTDDFSPSSARSAKCTVAPPNSPLEDDGPPIESMALRPIMQFESEGSFIGRNTLIYFIYYQPGNLKGSELPIAIKTAIP